jgi:two-component system, chemotaxis family, chemotaxis protein CheY
MSKILIADDSSFMRNVLKDILTPEGHELLEAENGQQAQEKISTDKPDLVLLDIIMPEADGLAVLKAAGPSTKVIIISAVGQEKMVEEAKALGALDYIVKPFENEKVLVAVNKVIG